MILKLLAEKIFSSRFPLQNPPLLIWRKFRHYIMYMPIFSLSYSSKYFILKMVGINLPFYLHGQNSMDHVLELYYLAVVNLK
jgi:hypothetical protein